METPGSRLRHARKNKGLTALELATAVDVHRTTITKIENGGLDPSMALAIKISYALDMSLDWWLKGILPKDELLIQHIEGILRNFKE